MFYYEVYIHTTQLAIVHTQSQQKINVLELTLAIHTHTQLTYLSSIAKRGEEGREGGRKEEREREKEVF